MDSFVEHFPKMPHIFCHVFGFCDTFFLGEAISKNAPHMLPNFFQIFQHGAFETHPTKMLQKWDPIFFQIFQHGAFVTHITKTPQKWDPNFFQIFQHGAFVTHITKTPQKWDPIFFQIFQRGAFVTHITKTPQKWDPMCGGTQKRSTYGESVSDVSHIPKTPHKKTQKVPRFWVPPHNRLVGIVKKYTAYMMCMYNRPTITYKLYGNACVCMLVGHSVKLKKYSSSFGKTEAYFN